MPARCYTFLLRSSGLVQIAAALAICYLPGASAQVAAISENATLPRGDAQVQQRMSEFDRQEYLMEQNLDLRDQMEADKTFSAVKWQMARAHSMSPPTPLLPLLPSLQGSPPPPPPLPESSVSNHSGAARGKCVGKKQFATWLDRLFALAPTPPPCGEPIKQGGKLPPCFMLLHRNTFESGGRMEATYGPTPSDAGAACGHRCRSVAEMWQMANQKRSLPPDVQMLVYYCDKPRGEG